MQVSDVLIPRLFRPNKKITILPNFTGKTKISSGFRKYIYNLCILKCQKKICVPALPKIFRPVTRNTLIFYSALFDAKQIPVL